MELADCVDTSRADGMMDNVALVERVHTALFLRGIIKSMDNTLTSTPSPDSLKKEDNLIVPPALYNFISLVLSGDFSGSRAVATTDLLSLVKRRTASSASTHRYVNSIGQDIIHCATDGRIRTPKHSALPLTVQHLTRSEQLVSVLNRFGHGYSPSKMLEYETAIAEKCLQGESEEGLFVPSNIDVERPAVFCRDNNDLREETLTGSGTTHCTNGIMIQRMDLQPSAAQRSSDQVCCSVATGLAAGTSDSVSSWPRLDFGWQRRSADMLDDTACCTSRSPEDDQLQVPWWLHDSSVLLLPPQSALHRCMWLQKL